MGEVVETRRTPAQDPEPPPEVERPGDRLGRRSVFALLGTLGALVAVLVPELGSDAWPFEPPSVDPRGLLGPLVRAADEEWDLGVVRSGAMVAGLVIALSGAAALRWYPWRAWVAVALTLVVIGLLTVPATLLQVGLRDATEPWYHTNDSTYQIELAGDLLLDGDNPYGHDYDGSGLERWYGAAGEGDRLPDDREEVALSHLAYFPGTPLTAAAWRVLPRPFDDYRLFVLLTTIASFFAVLLFRAPLLPRLVAGAVVAASPLAVRAAWFGFADAPSLLCLILAFAFMTRSRYGLAAASLGAAVLLKQFAVVAIPFLAIMLVTRGVPRPVMGRAAAIFGGVVLAGVLPFAIADAGALWDDTIAYGADTYRIVGYGLSGILLQLGVLDDRFGSYPFVPLALVLWLPLTAWLLWNQYRARLLWVGAAGFAVSMFMLLFLGRVLQNSYLAWPLVGIAIAFVLASAERSDETELTRAARAP